MISFPSLDCCKAITECRPATHSMYVLGHLVEPRGTGITNLFENSGSPSRWNSWWCHTHGCTSNTGVTERIEGSLSGYDGCHVNVDWFEWIGEDDMCFRQPSTRCTLTHARWGDHTNTHCYHDANIPVNPVEKALQIELKRVWSSKCYLVETGGIGRCKIVSGCGKAEQNVGPKEVTGCGLAMLLGVQLKHQLTQFCLGKLIMVLRNRTSQHSTQGNKWGSR